MESTMRITKFNLANLLIFLILIQTTFAQTTKRLALPKELQENIIPNFFVLAADNTEELYREDIKEKVKKTNAKRVVLSLFATYCLSCREEFAILKKNAGELKKQSVLVYLIDVGEDIHSYNEKVREMVETNAGKEFPYYFDPNAILPKTFGLVKKSDSLKLPLTIILDSDLKTIGILEGKMGSDFPSILWSNL